jgi:membrane protease YdiL (CAAX protease family)
MLVTVTTFEQLTAKNKLRRPDLRVLNYFHVLLMSFMLVTGCIINSGFFLLQFPGKITITQLTAFLIVFGLISVLPWKNFSNEVTVARYLSQEPGSRIASYTLLRTLFVLIYEWFFRGLLLLNFSALLGINWAIVINVLLYAVLHAPKSKKEMLGCIPLGLLLCVFTIWWQSIWPAIIFHTQLLIINEWPFLQKSISLQKQNAI